MQKYKVIADIVTGPGRKQYEKDAIVTDSELINIEDMVRVGAIVVVEDTPTQVPAKITKPAKD
jgi:hypothetical protein